MTLSLQDEGKTLKDIDFDEFTVEIDLLRKAAKSMQALVERSKI